MYPKTRFEHEEERARLKYGPLQYGPVKPRTPEPMVYGPLTPQQDSIVNECVKAFFDYHGLTNPWAR